MTYAELKRIFQEFNRNSPQETLTAHLIFTEDSFKMPYPLLSRTYCISSDNAAFCDPGGYSILGYCLDGTDPDVRLDWYIYEDCFPGDWRVEDCYILEQMRDVAAISNLTRAVQEDGAVCYLFGSARIRARESHENGELRLQPVTGEQTVCGERMELSIDRVYGYCTLLERHLNGIHKEEAQLCVS